jgi:elongation factor Tu
MLTRFLGGRTTPFMSNYRPQCFVRTADITVSLTFPEGTPDAHEKMVTSFAIISIMVPCLKTFWQVIPGDNVEMVCSLVFDVALEVGTRYAVVNFICIRRAAHTVL